MPEDPTVDVNGALTEALSKALGEAKIPLRQHLSVLEAFSKRLKESDEDRTKHQDLMDRHESTLDAHDEIFNRHEHQISQWDEVAQHLMDLAKGEQGESIQGEKGDPGEDGETPDIDALVNLVISRLGKPENGKDAEPVDEDTLISKLVDRIKNEQVLDISHIKGAKNYISQQVKSKDGFKKDGTKYKFEELMHGSGGRGGLATSTSLTGIANGINTVFTFIGYVLLPYTDTAPDFAATSNYNAASNISTVTYSVPPQYAANAILTAPLPTTASSSTLTRAELIDWTNSTGFTALSLSRDANEAITTGIVIWPDGSTGTFTTLVASTSFPGAVDSFQITYVPTIGNSYTITQPTVTRDGSGAVIAQPQLTIS